MLKLFFRDFHTPETVIIRFMKRETVEKELKGWYQY
jgi:hypothetical protein